METHLSKTVQLAREAGIELDLIDEDEGQIWYITTEGMKAFEALVRADERDKWMERTAILIRGEREACAKVCESEAEMFKSCAYGANDGRYDWKEDGARECAAAIRARGNT